MRSVRSRRIAAVAENAGQQRPHLLQLLRGEPEPKSDEEQRKTGGDGGGRSGGRAAKDY